MVKNLIYIFGLIFSMICISLFYAMSGQVSQENLYTVIEGDVEKHPTYREGDTLKIVTYNMGYLSGMTNNLPVERDRMLFANNLSNLIFQLENTNADFIGLQEVDFGSDRSFNIDQLQVLSDSLNFPYAYRSINWDKNYVPFPYWPYKSQFKRILSGQAIISKYPIVEQRTIKLVEPESESFFYKMFYLDRLVQISEIELQSGLKLTILNLHLEAFDKSTRQKQAIFIRDLIGEIVLKKQPVLLIGDFNSEPHFLVEDAMTEIAKISDMESSISQAEYQNDSSKAFTFNTSHPDKMIDYIFYSSSTIDKISSRVMTEYGEISDHFPVEMLFVIKPENDAN